MGRGGPRHGADLRCCGRRPRRWHRAGRPACSSARPRQGGPALACPCATAAAADPGCSWPPHSPLCSALSMHEPSNKGKRPCKSLHRHWAPFAHSPAAGSQAANPKQLPLPSPDSACAGTYSLLLCLAQGQHLANRPCARRRQSCAPAALEGAAAHKGLQVRHLAQRGRHAPGGQRHRLVHLLIDRLHLRARGRAVSPDACLDFTQVPHDSLRMS